MNNSEKRLGKITEAGNNTSLIKIKYKDKKGNITTRKVEPYKIDGEDFWAYDVAKDSIRRFKLNQIKSTVSLKTKYEPRWDIEMNKVAFYMDAIEKIASEKKKKEDPYKMTKMVGLTNLLGIPGDFLFDTTVEGIDVYKNRNTRKVGNSVIKTMKSPEAKKAFNNLLRKQKGAALPMSMGMAGAMTIPVFLSERKAAKNGNGSK